MRPPYTGRCLCDAVQYRVTADPVTVYACHCTDCQKRSGSAFSVSMWVPRASFQATGQTLALQSARLCPACGTRVWSEPDHRPHLLVIRTGTLDDTSWLRPVAHMWTRSAQPWFAFPEGVARYEKQAEFAELERLWRERA